MGGKIVKVVASPFPIDYTDGNDPPPWSYEESAFRNWVYEVLLDCGKAGSFPQSVQEAIEIAENAGYILERI